MQLTHKSSYSGVPVGYTHKTKEDFQRWLQMQMQMKERKAHLAEDQDPPPNNSPAVMVWVDDGGAT